MEIRFSRRLQTVFANKVSIIKHFKRLTVFVHSHRHAFLQTTCLALISMCFVDDATPGSSLASVKTKFRDLNKIVKYSNENFIKSMELRKSDFNSKRKIIRAKTFSTRTNWIWRIEGEILSFVTQMEIAEMMTYVTARKASTSPDDEQWKN